MITPKRVRQNTNDTNEYCYIKVNKIQKGGLGSYPFFLRCLYEARKVSDEVYFLIKCSENKVARQQLFQQISQKCKNFTSLSNEQKIFWMLSCEDQSILTSVGKFRYDHMP